MVKSSISLISSPCQDSTIWEFRSETLHCRFGGFRFKGCPRPEVSTRGAVSVAFHGSGFAFRLLRPIGLSGFGFKGFKVKGFRV